MIRHLLLIAFPLLVSACRPGNAPGGSLGNPVANPTGDPAGDSGAMGALGPQLPFFSTAYVEESQTLDVPSNGDLWVSIWGDDDNVYVANGDGKGFGTIFDDVVVNRLSGTPATGMSGVALARGAQVSSIWTPAAGTLKYNRKPTGMVSVDGVLYLAVQDLATNFMDAPAATITRSDDHGATWSWDHNAPMFDAHRFTTIFFADYGKNNQHAPDDFVYAYGLDGNWRWSTRVASPTALYLARVPKSAVQDRSQWQFYGGLDGAGQPTWSADIDARQPALDDPTTIYQQPIVQTAANVTLLSQGSVVYDAPLKRYLYTSWSEYSFEFYEAPRPWGPWKKFLSKVYGVKPWFADKNGGYATTIPSKFISDDGKSMYVQSNTFQGGQNNYRFSLRKLLVEPYRVTAPIHAPAGQSLSSEPGTTLLAASVHRGHDAYLNDGVTTGQSEDSWDGDTRTEDFWGYAWPRAYFLDRVAYTTGQLFPAGGWFSTLRVQVRQQGAWVDAQGLTITPSYPFDATTPANTTFTLSFSPTTGDAVRIIGTPGGAAFFTSVAELAVFDGP